MSFEQLRQQVLPGAPLAGRNEEPGLCFHRAPQAGVKERVALGAQQQSAVR
jgi:hypothetical protein